MRILSLFTTIIFALIPLIAARQPPISFCKCICFTNSTIIPLNSPPQTDVATSSSSALTALSHLFTARDEDVEGHDSSQHKRLTCSDCTRAFCLDYNLPICKGAKEEDVFTACFQRDSLKDEMIVLLFIVLTAGLLGWALLKPWLDKLRDTESGQGYTPLGNLSLAGLVRGTDTASVRPRSTLPAYRDGQGRQRSQDSGGTETFAWQGGLNS